MSLLGPTLANNFTLEPTHNEKCKAPLTIKLIVVRLAYKSKFAKHHPQKRRIKLMRLARAVKIKERRAVYLRLIQSLPGFDH